MPFPVTLEQIRKTEDKLGRTLPPSFVGRMVEDNGGVVSTETDDWWLLPVFDDTDRKRLKRTCNDILRETKSAREWPEFPETAIAIGKNGAGDLLVFLPAKSSNRYADTVYAWNHETGEIVSVADDFVDLPKRSG